MTSSPREIPPWSLINKTAIITGGSRGIGRATAYHLAHKGLSNLVITYAGNAQAARETTEECKKLGVQKAIAIQADVLDPEFGPKIVTATLEALQVPVIDILVNNAVLGDQTKVQPVKDTTLSTFLQVMQGNVYAPLALTTAIMPHLPKYGGRVINICSVLGAVADDPTMTYGASKAALQSFTRSLALAFGKTTGATFNSVVVGLTMTDSIKASQDLMPAGFFDAMIANTTAAERIGLPDDIAYIVGFLSSEEGRWVNGAALSANGGNKDLLAALG